MAGMIVGVVTAIVVKFHRPLLGLDGDTSYLWAAWWSFVAAVAGAVVVSLVTKAYDRERLRGLVCWIPLEGPAK
jgi:uncharacterized membrane protein YeaQ/YmgE (transglycosylase-associated protein family)